MALPAGFVLDPESAQSSALPSGFVLDQESAAAAPAGDYKVEAARKGLAGTAGAVAGIGNVVSETLSSLGINPLDISAKLASYLTGNQQPAQRTPEQAAQAYQTGREAVRQPLMQAMGSTGAQPQTGGQRILAAGIEAGAGLENYLFPALAATRRMGMFGQAVARPGEQVVIGAGAEGGGQAGGAFGAKMGGETGAMVGQITGGLLGGAGSAYTSGQLLKSGPVVNKGFDLLKQQWQKVKGTVPENELMKQVDSNISSIFNAAMDADPNTRKLIEDAIKAQQSVSLKAPGAAEVKLPLSAILANNPVIDEQIRKLSGQNPEFKAMYGAQYDNAKLALTQNQNLLFGDPSKAVIKAAGPDLTNLQARRVKSLDEQIGDAYKNQSIDSNVFGKRVTDLVEKKEKAAYAEVKPLYTEAFDIAKAKNMELPASSVDDIYNSVVASKDSDVFRTFKPIFSKVERIFKPTATEPSAILTAEGKPMRPAGREFSAATIEDLDSLKREINSSLRKTDVPTEIRLLTDLKQRVAGHIDSLDPDFVTAYRNADKAYLTKVGLPFDTATLNAIGRKKFAEQVAPALIGNKSNVSEFLAVTGDQGVPLVRSAFLDAFSTAALKNDVLDPKAAAKWLKKNEGGVSLVPGLRDELQAATSDVQRLLAERTRLNADFQRVAADQILSKEGVKSPQELVSKMYGDVKFTNRFMSKSGYGEDKDSVNAVRAFMLDDIVNAIDPVAMLSDRNRAAVFNRVFGPTYAKKVADFAVASGRLKVDPTNVAFRTETVPKTGIEEVTGSSPQQIISRLMNPVSGPLYAATSTVSKFWARQASENTTKKMIALLSDPSEAVKFMDLLEKSKKSLSPERLEELARIGAKYGIQWVADAAQDAATGAARGAVQQPQE
jgi:hypothetical protein